MTTYATWDNSEQTVIHIHLETGWTWNDFMDSFQAGYALIYSTNHLVDIIITGLDWNIPPGNMLSRLKRVHQENPDNLGVIISVGYNPIWDKIAGILARVYPADNPPLAFADSLDEAREMLAQRTRFAHAG